MRWVSRSEAETAEIGREIALQIPPDAVLYLSGDLGAGKTTLVRSIAAALGCDPDDVASPSFSIVHEYPREGRDSVFHVDGYRMSDHPHEWMEIGIDEMLRGPGVKLIEWPKREFSELAATWAVVRVTVEDDDARMIEMER